MKSKFLSILIISLLFLSGCSLNKYFDKSDIQGRTTGEINSIDENADDLFKKKLICAEYLDNIENKLQDDREFSLERRVLVEIFYSPTVDSCLYYYTVRYVDANNAPDEKIMGIDHIINDWLAGDKTLIRYNTVVNSDPYNNYNYFQEELLRLKGEKVE